MGESKLFTPDEIEELKRWHKSPLVERLINVVVQDTVVQWMVARTQSEREECWHRAQAATHLHEKIGTIINDQKLAEYNAQRRNAWTMPSASVS